MPLLGVAISIVSVVLAEESVSRISSMLRCIRSSRHLWSCYSATTLPSCGKIFQFSLIALLWMCVTVLLFRLSTHSTTHMTLSVVHKSPYLQTESENGWCQNHSALPVQVLSKELIIRGAFFDGRTRDGFSNATVFLVEAKGKKLGRKNFAGCRVGPYISEVFHFRPAVSYQVVRRKRNGKSTLALIDCYNIHSASNGDPASLYYKSTHGVKVEIPSLKPLSVPKPTFVPNPSGATVVVCVGMIRSGKHSPSDYGMLYHWLRYQKVIGVDHVHMAVENSFVRDGGLQHDVIQRAVREGYLSIAFWPFWLSPTEVFNSQKLAYQDCIYRFQGVYDYIIYADSDDFFVPVERSKSIKHYLQKWCTGMTATCRFQWIQSFPDCGWDPNLIGADGNFTKSVTYNETMKRPVPKSGHQLKALVDAGTHKPNILLRGYKQTEVPVWEAYFAHVRFGKHPTGEC